MRMTTLSRLFIIIVLLHLTHSENARADSCDSIIDVDQKLECITDNLKNEPAPVSVVSKPKKPRASIEDARGLADEANNGAWNTESSVSAITDTLDVASKLESSTPIPGRYHTEEDPIFVIMCRDNRTNIYFIMGHHWFYPDHVVTTRIDKERAVTSEWSASTDNEAAFHRDPITFAKQLIGKHRLIIQTAPISEPVYEATFYIDGVNEAVKAVRAACGW